MTTETEPSYVATAVLSMMATAYDDPRMGMPPGKKEWKWPSVAHLILDQGYRFTRLKHPRKMGPPKACFYNAWRRVLTNDWYYVEGYAFGGLIPVHHAWNLDKKGNVIESTWRPDMITSEIEYVGVPINICWPGCRFGVNDMWSVLFRMDSDEILRTDPAEWLDHRVTGQRAERLVTR